MATNAPSARLSSTSNANATEAFHLFGISSEFSSPLSKFIITLQRRMVTNKKKINRASGDGQMKSSSTKPRGRQNRQSVTLAIGMFVACLMLAAHQPAGPHVRRRPRAGDHDTVEALADREIMADDNDDGVEGVLPIVPAGPPGCFAENRWPAQSNP
jgi:hypothetical protein